MVTAKGLTEEDHEQDQQRLPFFIIYFINVKCIAGLPSFLWPRFPSTYNKPVVGHSSTVISREVWSALVERGLGGPHDPVISFGGSRGYPGILL